MICRLHLNIQLGPDESQTSTSKEDLILFVFLPCLEIILSSKPDAVLINTLALLGSRLVGTPPPLVKPETRQVQKLQAGKPQERRVRLGPWGFPL